MSTTLSSRFHNLNGTLSIQGKTYQYTPLSDLDHLGNWKKLPYSLKILLENIYRHTPSSAAQTTLQALIAKSTGQHVDFEIAFNPARVLMQDFTGVPAIVDLAAMRDAVASRNGDPKVINPEIPVDLVIDHSVMVDFFASHRALGENVRLEFERNQERYAFLKWGTKAFKNFRVVPPGTGICHQVNLEYLAKGVWQTQLNETQTIIYPDTVVGTDSHTTMINGLGVLGWGVGGIEAEAAMLGQSLSMLIPRVLGVHLIGTLPSGCTATDLVLTITQTLRKKGVVGQFVEYFGDGLSQLSLADRATIANMAPEYGATCGIFPIDDETLHYMELTGRSAHEIELCKDYALAQGLWRDDNQTLSYDEVLTIDLSAVEPAVAGPKRPQDRVPLTQLKSVTQQLIALPDDFNDITVNNLDHSLQHHDVVLAAITSCTNTSNPSVLIAAGLVAKKAKALGLTVKPWVKTSFAPGSQVVGDYLKKAGLMEDLEALGFHIVGYGCTTCIGNSGPLPAEIVEQIEEENLTVSGVLSGNRNFEGRINPHIKANYLASPPLVIAFALSGTTHINLTEDVIAYSPDGKGIYLRDIWPSAGEVQEILNNVVTSDLFQSRYAKVFEGDENWQNITVEASDTYTWQTNSTYVQSPPYFKDSSDDFTNSMKPRIEKNIEGARILALLGDSITTDHISPAGSIKEKSPAGQYLLSNHVDSNNFNSYGARRGNHQVMMRGTFANIRLQNEQTPDITGGYTRCYSAADEGSEVVSIFDAAITYMNENTPLVVISGQEYGTGSSRDWAAKGTRLLGISAVIAESFERIHRSNLVGMGILPLEFTNGVNRKTLNLTGDEIIDISGLESHNFSTAMTLHMHIHRKDGTTTTTPLLCRVDTLDEVNYIKAGTILHHVVNMMIKR